MLKNKTNKCNIKSILHYNRPLVKQTLSETLAHTHPLLRRGDIHFTRHTNLHDLSTQVFRVYLSDYLNAHNTVIPIFQASETGKGNMSKNFAEPVRMLHFMTARKRVITFVHVK